jgi:hypothetical protein
MRATLWLRPGHSGGPPMIFSFIRLVYAGSQASGVGLAFDNFSPVDATGLETRFYRAVQTRYELHVRHGAWLRLGETVPEESG